MELASIVDWYTLEYIIQDMSQRTDTFQSIARRTFLERVERQFETLTNDLLSCFRDYLFVASFAEARHASARADFHFPDLDSNRFSRGAAMQGSLSYNARDTETLDALIELYDCDWHSSYGGAAWRNIVKALKNSYTMPATIWIDHVIDMEHNAGNVFNKTEAGNTLDMSFHFYHALTKFLNDKSNADNYVMDCLAHLQLWLSHTSKRLLSGYIHHVWRVERISIRSPQTGYFKASLSYSRATWGDMTLSSYDLESSDVVELCYNTEQPLRSCNCYDCNPRRYCPHCLNYDGYFSNCTCTTCDHCLEKWQDCQCEFCPKCARIEDDCLCDLCPKCKLETVDCLEFSHLCYPLEEIYANNI